MAEPRHPSAEEAPGVAHRATDPEVPAARLRERGAELHVGHGGEHRHDEVQPEREDEGRPRDRVSRPDKEEDRGPDRRAEPDHRDLEQTEVPAELDRDLPTVGHGPAQTEGSLLGLLRPADVLQIHPRFMEVVRRAGPPTLALSEGSPVWVEHLRAYECREMCRSVGPPLGHPDVTRQVAHAKTQTLQEQNALRDPWVPCFLEEDGDLRIRF